MSKKRTTKPQRDFEAMVPDGEMRQRLFDHLSSGARLLSEGSPFAELLQGAVNNMLGAEVDHHLEQQKLEDPKSLNKRNGYTQKQVTSEFGDIQIQTPRDRDGSFAPQLIAKRSRDLTSGIDEQIIALYAQGNSIEDVRRLVKKLYCVDVSAGHITAITNKVWEDLEAWRSRPLKQGYAVVYLDAVFFRVRGSGDGPRNKGSKFESRASFTVYAIDFAGNRDILGIYLMESEGAMAWGRVLEDLRNRGMEEVFCFCIDGLSGFADVIREVYPKSIVQRCIVHQTRHTTRFCSDAHAKAVRRDLRKIYTAVTMEEALSQLEAFKEEWDEKYPKISESWENNWDDLMAFLEFPEDLRRIIYTTNPVESVHRIIRKLIKGKAAWSSESGLIKQLYLSLMHNKQSWQRKANKWKPVQLVFEHYDNGYWAKYLPN